MDTTMLVALNAVVLVASLLQAATGIGIGLLAGPVILLALNSGAAIQISMMMSLLIALVLAPSLWRSVDRAVLKRVLLGSVAGFPLGILVFQAIDIDSLKLLAGAVVFYMVLSVTGTIRLPVADPADPAARGVRDLGVGVLSGLMGTSLAMPGPAVAARMAALSNSKEAIRATVLVTLALSNIAAVGFQAAMVGITVETLVLMAWLAPATLAGVIAGRLVAGRFSERGFRVVLVLLLAGTSVSLIADALLGMLGHV